MPPRSFRSQNVDLSRGNGSDQIRQVVFEQCSRCDVSEQVVVQRAAHHIIHPGVDGPAHGYGGESFIKGGGMEDDRPGPANAEKVDVVHVIAPGQNVRRAQDMTDPLPKKRTADMKRQVGDPVLVIVVLPIAASVGGFAETRDIDTQHDPSGTNKCLDPAAWCCVL